MKMITTSQDFAALLNAERAVVFTFFDWSGQAHLSLRVFQNWEREWVASNPLPPIAFFRLDPDNLKVCWDWIVAQAHGDEGTDGGFGATIWVRRGEGIGFLRFTAMAGEESLARLTRKYFCST
jgi:hypothetical protein